MSFSEGGQSGYDGSSFVADATEQRQPLFDLERVKDAKFNENELLTLDVENLLAEVEHKVSPYIRLRTIDAVGEGGKNLDNGYPDVAVSYRQREHVHKEHDLDDRWREILDVKREAADAGIMDQDSPTKPEKDLAMEKKGMVGETKEVTALFHGLESIVEKMLVVLEKNKIDAGQCAGLYGKAHILLKRMNEMLPGVLQLETGITRYERYGSSEYKKHEKSKEKWRVTKINNQYITSSRGRLKDKAFVDGLNVEGQPGTEEWYKNLPESLRDFRGFIFLGVPEWKSSEDKRGPEIVRHDGTDLKYTAFDDSISSGFRSFNLAGAEADGASFRNCTFRDAFHSFQGIHAPGADFTGASFSREIDFKDADLQGSKFDAIKWSKYDSHGPFGDFTGANLTGVSFRGADLGVQNLRYEQDQVRTIGTSFENATLTGVDFTGAKLKGCEFWGAKGIPLEVRRNMVPGYFAGGAKFLDKEGRKQDKDLYRKMIEDAKKRREKEQEEGA